MNIQLHQCLHQELLQENIPDDLYFTNGYFQQINALPQFSFADYMLTKLYNNLHM